MTFEEAMAEIQQMVDEGKPIEEVCAVLERHIDDGTIVIADAEIVVPGAISFSLDLEGEA